MYFFIEQFKTKQVFKHLSCLINNKYKNKLIYKNNSVEIHKKFMVVFNV